MSYYRVIRGIRHDRVLLQAAEELIRSEQCRCIALLHIRKLLKKALSGDGFNSMSRRTLLFIRDHFCLTDQARDWLSRSIPNNPDYLSAARSALDRAGLQQIELINSTFDNKDIHSQNAHSQLSFYEAVELLPSLLKGNDPYLYQGMIAGNQTLSSHQYGTTPQTSIALEAGSLYLLPDDFQRKHQERKFVYEIPKQHRETEPIETWTFGLLLEAYPDIVYFIKIPRYRNEISACSIQGLYRSHLNVRDKLIQMIDRHLEQSSLKIFAEAEEIERQEALDRRAFEEALFYTILIGLSNPENDGFQHLLQQVGELEPGDAITTAKIKEYLNVSHLHLVPLDLEERKLSGTLPYPIPDWVDQESILSDWTFVMEFPGKSKWRLLLNFPRFTSDKSLRAWSTAYY